MFTSNQIAGIVIERAYSDTEQIGLKVIHTFRSFEICLRKVFEILPSAEITPRKIFAKNLKSTKFHVWIKKSKKSDFHVWIKKLFLLML